MNMILTQVLRRFSKDERGQGMVEYGLIIAVVAVVAVIALTSVGTQLSVIFNNIVGKLVVPT